ncbi:MAG: formate dehydrogenase subunit alpha [Alistipes senegalensis]|nr:formate dehydrogenase subunit alpha [Oxalobacter formigenes]MCM1281758.1 formate dehydrogenase subunit alpha [Alistipes senegalensis]
MEKVITVCPYCASGCKINLVVQDGKIIRAEGANGVTNQGELCLKGYYGWEFLNDTRLLTPRLTQPMIRRERGGDFEVVSWDEAIAFASSRLLAVREKYGPDAIMMTGSSRGPGNEANYIAQKVARAVVGTNNIDCCARVCHAPSVSGLEVTLGNGAMSNSICEIEDTDCILVFGYNAADSHPIVARRILKAKEKGAKIIVCDPRVIETVRIADLHLPLKNGSNMALVNAFANVLLEEGLYNEEYVEQYAEGFDAYREVVSRYTPEYVSEITGLDPDLIRDAMYMYASAPSATILWGMGVTQWGQAVDVVKGLSSLAVMTGNLGRPNVGVGPVRGQNNVQGACDMGALPGTLPGYYRVWNPEHREKFARAWGVPSIPEKVGLHLTEVPHAIHDGKLKACWIFGEDPLQTEPDLSSLRKEYEKLELIIVQDIFMTKTAMMADVILPATSWGEHEGVYSSADRGFQRFYKAVEPKGNVKPDWEIHSLMATAMGYPMKYRNTQEIWDELRGICDLYRGATYEKMAGLGYVPWPCPDEDHPGTPWLYEGNRFDTPSGKALLFAAEWRGPMESTDAEFPLTLCTVREVGHYSCRSMTGNCSALQTLANEPGYVQIHPEDASKLGIRDQELVWIASRRGRVMTRANLNERANAGAVYMTYQWWIGACNELTAEHLDPISKTPEHKYCAVKIEAIPDQAWAERYVAETYEKMKADMRDAVKVAEAA